MDRKNIAYKLIIPENTSLGSVKISSEAFEKIKKQFGKTADEYIKEFLNDDKLYNEFQIEFDKCVELSLPLNLDCEYCKSGDLKQGEKACAKYVLQMNFTYINVATEFVRIVLENRHVFTDSKYLRRLTAHFFSCLKFIKGEGVLSFDLDKLTRLILNEGFSAINEFFINSNTLLNLKITNETLDKLESKSIELELFNKEDYQLIGIQKNFFEAKKGYLQTSLLIEKEEKEISKSIPKKTNESRPTSTDLAFFVHYLSETKYEVSTEVFPSEKAWKEIGQKYSKNWKNIQLKFNSISKKEKRINKNNGRIISYIIENLLPEFPLAQKLAEDELTLSKLSN